jgi:hypothetical protein
MATPIVAGAVALVRQFIKKALGKDDPIISAALVKALLINGAERRSFSGVPCPLLYDMVQGWGHLNLENILKPSGGRNIAWCDAGSGLFAEDYQLWEVLVQHHGEEAEDEQNFSVPFKVTLTWMDLPGSPLHGGKLINDLDLVVITPSGKPYNGNRQEEPFDQGTDTTNNVECVLVKKAEPGTYRIRVSRKPLPDERRDGQQNSQSFALVWSGRLSQSGPQSPSQKGW